MAEKLLRDTFGDFLVKMGKRNADLVVLDSDVSTSTRTNKFANEFPHRFFNMGIAEQNMVGTALGFSRRGKIPFISTFAAFFTRAFDQIRMSQYSDPNIKFVGSHAGVSIGEDGASQMGLEDFAMFRTPLNSVVLYPSDAVSTEKLVEEAAKHHGLVYIRTTRQATPVIYNNEEEFPIGGSKVLRESNNDLVTVIAAGITLFEALSAYEELKKDGISIRVVDLYSLKPVDSATLHECANTTKALITVEDHFLEGGLGEAVKSAFTSLPVPLYCLAVTRMPKSGKPQELLDYEGISKNAIFKKIKEMI